jgi:hypothetical protein
LRWIEKKQAVGIQWTDSVLDLDDGGMSERSRMGDRGQPLWFEEERMVSSKVVKE